MSNGMTWRVPALAAVALAAWLGLCGPTLADTEAARVTREACGEDPEPECLAQLKKVCRAKITFKCYYARKRRIDGDGAPDTPERADERDDRSIFYDE